MSWIGTADEGSKIEIGKDTRCGQDHTIEVMA
jgi:hypothetical protein